MNCLCFTTLLLLIAGVAYCWFVLPIRRSTRGQEAVSEPCVRSYTQRVSLSTLGIIFSEAASPCLLPGVLEDLHEIILTSEVYFITCLPPGVTERAVLKLLLDTGLVGGSCVPVHRALFCTTAVGSVALARQLAADLHLESCAVNVNELRRFGGNVVQVTDGNLRAAVRR